MEKLKNGQRGMALLTQRLKGKDKGELLGAAFVLLEGILLPNAVVLQGMAPFGIAYVSCFFMQRWKTPMFLSAGLGYLLAMGRVEVLKYWICLVLIYMFTLAYEKAGRVTDEIYLVPFVTSATLLSVGGIFVAFHGFLMADVLRLISETLLCFLASALFMGALPTMRYLGQQHTIKRSNLTGVLLLLTISILPFAPVPLGDLSVGRIMGAMLVQAVLLMDNISFAAMGGILVGLGMGMYDSSHLMLCTSYGCGALVGSIFGAQSKFLAMVAFVLTSGMICIYGAPASYTVLWLYENMIAAVLVMLLPTGRLKGWMEQKAPTMGRTLHEGKLRELTISRLHSLAEGFRDAYETVQYVSDRLRKVNFLDDSTLFEEANRKVCKNCVKSLECWGRGYDTSMDRMEHLLPLLRKNSAVTAGELSEAFHNSCIKPQELATALTQSYGGFLLRRKVSEQQAISRRLECNQFMGVSGVIEQMARELDQEYRFDSAAEERLGAYLEANGIHPLGILVMYDGDDRVRVEIDIRMITDFHISSGHFTQKVCELIDDTVDNFVIENRKEYYKLVLTKREVFHPVYSYTSRKKTGESFNGDTPLVFRNNKGKLIMVVADGMGSGKRAAVDSTMAVKIVEKIMTGGFDSRAALHILNNAMSLSGDQQRTTAVDITVVDLHTGGAEFVKAGAAPTYVKKGGEVIRLDNSCIPTGVLENIHPQTRRLSLRENDYIVMVSDGVCGEDDRFLLEILKEGNFQSPKELAGLILDRALGANNGKCTDDCTVLAMQM
jgi:stage II sporulation protein E